MATAKSSKPKRAIGYIRVSERGGRAGPEYHTLDIQRASIEKICALREYELVDVYVEENKSGADATRPKFRDAMRRIVDEREADALAVWKVSRFSRSWAQAARDTEALLERGARSGRADPADLLSGEEGFDTSTIGGRLLLRILFSIAEWEREVLTEQWEGIKRSAIERGSHLGRTPFGYVRVALEPTKPWHVSPDMAARLLDEWAAKHGGAAGDFEPVPGLLVPHSEYGEVVGEVFAARRDGASWADVTRLLDARAPRPDGGLWFHTHAKRMVTLRTYLGEVGQSGEVLDFRNRSAHVPLVGRQLFLAVQTVEKGQVRRASTDYWLSAKVYCAGCSYRMGGSHQTYAARVYADTGEPVGRGRRTDLHADRPIVEERRSTRVYRCPGKRGTGRCPAPAMVLADDIERLVWERGAALLETRVAAHGVDDDPEIVELDEQIAEADEAILEMSSVEMRRDLKENWAPSLRKLRAQKEALIRERDERAAQSPAADGPAVEAGSLAEQWAALRDGVQAVFVERAPRHTPLADRVDVVWIGEDAPPLGGPTNRIKPTRYVLREHGDDPAAGVAAGDAAAQ